MNLEIIKSRLKKFAEERDWEQFHNPKNISMALSVEVAELVEIFQWSNSGGLEEVQDPEIKAQIEREIADMFNYLIAHNCHGFDEIILKKILKESNSRHLLDNICFIDTLLLARKLMPELNRFSQKSLCDYFKIIILLLCFYMLWKSLQTSQLSYLNVPRLFHIEIINVDISTQL